MVVLSILAASTAASLLGIAYWASPIAILIGLPCYFGRTNSTRLHLMIGAGLGAALAFLVLAAWLERQTGDFVISMTPLKAWLATVLGGLIGIACVAGICVWYKTKRGS